MHSPTYLHHSRHGIWYFRYALPVGLFPKQPASQIYLSLQTRNPKLALQLSRRLVACAEYLLTHPNTISMDFQSIRQLLQTHFKQERDQYKQRIAEYGPLPPADLAALRHGEEEATLAAEEARPMVDSRERVSSLLEKNQIKLKPATASFKLLETEYAKAYRDYCASVLEYNKRFDGYQFRTAPEILAMRKNMANKPNRPLSDAIARYTEEKIRLQHWGKKSQQEFASHFDLLKEYLGEDAGLNLSSETANDVQRMLLRLPKFARTSDTYKGLSIAEIISKDWPDKLGAATINKHLNTYSGLYDWAVKRREVDDNFFKDLKVKEKKGSTPNREAFTVQQVQKMLARFEDSSFSCKASMRWGTLLGIFTGARREEIAQLHVDDIKQEDGIWFADINEQEDKKLKNEASTRRVCHISGLRR